jgi:large subunit ribosomal protein L21
VVLSRNWLAWRKASSNRGSAPLCVDFKAALTYEQPRKSGVAPRRASRAGTEQKGQKMFAVIKTGGKQYRVAADQVLEIGRVAGEIGDIVEIGHVLAHGNGDDVTIGAPLVSGASVSAEIIDQNRAEKVIAFKKRRRQNSRRKRGHRQLLTTVRISEILLDGAKPSKKASEKKAAKAEAGDETPKAAKKAAPKKAAAKTEAAEAGE